MDLSQALPDFDTSPYIHLLYSLEKNEITVGRLISADPREIARTCPLPYADVQKLVADVIRALQHDLEQEVTPKRQIAVASRAKKIVPELGLVCTLDDTIDAALNGGIRPGHITEVAGESATGKTQLCFSLLLSAQLPAPRGLGKATIYVSTEGPLNTTRLNQILRQQPVFDNLPPEERPSLDNVHTITVGDLESQERVVSHQLPIAVQRYNVGLVVLDSVAANFRAEHDTGTAAQRADRAIELTKLGNILRRIAIEYQVAVVVTNQVSDRFDNVKPQFHSSPLPAASSPATPGTHLPAEVVERRQETQSLNYQQGFFSGWGGDEDDQRRGEQMKTPALGLAWVNQVSARIVLKMESEEQDFAGGNIWKDRKRRRTFRVVFAPWAPTTNPPIRYEIATQGLVSASESEQPQRLPDVLAEQYPELLDESFWASDKDEEYP